MSGVLRAVVLASASPRRLELLRSLGVNVEVVPSGYDEAEIPGATPAEIASRHARAKLDAVAASRPGRVVIGADTIVDVDDRALRKPRDPDDARAMLRMLSGRAHRVHTAYALASPRGTVERLSTTTVRFHALEPEEIDEYVASGEPTDKAGAYGIQGLAAALVASIEGDYFTVMGFPLGDFIRTVRKLGFSLPAANSRRT